MKIELNKDEVEMVLMALHARERAYNNNAQMEPDIDYARRYQRVASGYADLAEKLSIAYVEERCRL